MKESIEVFTVKSKGGDPNQILKDIQADPVAGPALDAFTKRCRQYHQRVHDEAVKGLSPEAAAIFERWWNGECVQDEKNYDAHSAILWACSAGCG